MKYILALALPLALSACTATHNPDQRYAWEEQLIESPALMSTITDPFGLGNDDNASGEPYYLEFNKFFPPKSGEPALPWDN